MHHNNEVSWPWSDPEIALNTTRSALLYSTHKACCVDLDHNKHKKTSLQIKKLLYILCFLFCISSEVAFSRNMRNDFFIDYSNYMNVV